MGVLTFEMLTGKLPFSGSNRMEVAYATVNSPIPSAVKINTNRPDELDALLGRVPANDPANRPQTIRDLLAQMARLPQRRTGPPGTAAAQPAVAAAMALGVAGAPRPVVSAGPDTASMRTIPSSPPMLHGSPLPTPTASATSAIRTLELMGVRPARGRGRFILNSHFRNRVHVAREVAGDRWPEVAYASGLVQYVEQDPPHDDQLSSPVESLSRLNEAFETIYGPEAEDQIRAWARRATERWLAEGKHGLGGARRFMQGRQRKLLGIVKSFTESMDNVRGEHTHSWLQVDEHQFWLVNFSNMFALGRIKTVKSCYMWTSTIETILRWGGLANDSYLEEVESGCVTGTFDCALPIRPVDTEVVRLPACRGGGRGAGGGGVSSYWARGLIPKVRFAVDVTACWRPQRVGMLTVAIELSKAMVAHRGKDEIVLLCSKERPAQLQGLDCEAVLAPYRHEVLLKTRCLPQLDPLLASHPILYPSWPRPPLLLPPAPPP